jgi:hypothetical protein
MKTLHLLILTLTFFVVNGFSQSSLSLKIQLEKESILLKESAFIGIIINNESSSEVTIADPDLGLNYLSLEVLDGRGKKLEYYGPQMNAIAKPYVKILAGSEYFKLYDLRYMYGESAGVLPLTRDFKLGKYTLQAKYMDNGIILNSNIVTLSVVEPQGVEKEAYRSFNQALQSLMISKGNKKIKPSSELAVAAFSSFAENYSSSAYTPLSLSIAGILCKWGIRDKIRANRYNYKIIENYSTSGHIVGALEQLKKEIEARSDKEEYLRKVIERASGSLGGKSIQRIMKNQNEQTK